VRMDRRAVEGLPLRLMLMALLISLTVPTMLSVMGSTSTKLRSQEMAEVADDLAGTIEEMAAAGPGNVRVIDVPSMPAGMGLFIGGADGSVESMRISWCSDGTVLGSRYLDDVSVMTVSGGPIEISSGDTLHLTYASDGCVQAAIG
jgi:hypothetical protein